MSLPLGKWSNLRPELCMHMYAYLNWCLYFYDYVITVYIYTVHSSTNWPTTFNRMITSVSDAGNFPSLMAGLLHPVEQWSKWKSLQMEKVYDTVSTSRVMGNISENSWEISGMQEALQAPIRIIPESSNYTGFGSIDHRSLDVQGYKSRKWWNNWEMIV